MIKTSNTSQAIHLCGPYHWWEKDISAMKAYDGGEIYF